MANVDQPFGFKILKGGGKLLRCFVPSSDGTALYAGDPVALAGSADTKGEAPTVARLAAGSSAPMLGIIESVETFTDDLKYRAASTNRYVNVRTVIGCTELIAQGDGSVAATDVGNDVDVIYTTAGSTVTGVSGAEFDTGTTTAIGSGTQFRILRLHTDPNNALGANAVMVLNPLKYQQTDGAAGV